VEVKDLGYTPRMARWAAGLAFAAAAALSCTTVAHAQTSAEGQYAKPTAPSGPAAGLQSCGAGDGGQLGAGSTIVFPGDFSIASGASVVVQDADGTQGTLIDGQNASITGNGGIRVEVTGDPTNVSGGDGVLNGGAGCNSIVATTGVSGNGTAGGSASFVAGTSANATSGGSAGVAGGSGGAAGESSGGGAVVGILPDTGGASFVLLAALAAVGTGLVILQRLRAARR
jgi:hypothetical protein